VSRLARIAAVLALVVAGCGSSYRPPAPPTEAEARAHLDAVVDLVQAGAFRRVCELGVATCESFLEDANPVAVPRDRPVVTGIRTVDPVDHGDGTWSNGGVLFDLCGIDGLGAEYHSQMLVIRRDGRLLSIQPVYWLGVGVALDPVVGAPEPPPAPCPLP
jgi:hypothetical protein